jgi:hypothetical protein
LGSGAEDKNGKNRYFEALCGSLMSNLINFRLHSLRILIHPEFLHFDEHALSKPIPKTPFSVKS